MSSSNENVYRHQHVMQDYYQQQSAGPPPAYAAHVPAARLPYHVTYNVPPRPSFHGPVNMYAHPPSPVQLASPTTPPAAWRQPYIPQQLPMLSQPPMHVSRDYHAAGMPPSYQLGVMSPPPAPCPYPPATSPALHQQYQYRAAPAAPMRVAAPCSDYYIPVMNEQRSYPVNIPNSQQQQPQQQCFAGVYETRACTPTTLPGVPMYYQQPPQEPPSVAPNKREKKIINIIDPRTGINVISDLRSSSSAEWKSLTNEIPYVSARNTAPGRGLAARTSQVTISCSLPTDSAAVLPTEEAEQLPSISDCKTVSYGTASGSKVDQSAADELCSDADDRPSSENTSVSVCSAASLLDTRHVSQPCKSDDVEQFTETCVDRSDETVAETATKKHEGNEYVEQLPSEVGRDASENICSHRTRDAVCLSVGQSDLLDSVVTDEHSLSVMSETEHVQTVICEDAINTPHLSPVSEEAVTDSPAEQCSSVSEVHADGTERVTEVLDDSRCNDLMETSDVAEESVLYAAAAAAVKPSTGDSEELVTSCTTHHQEETPSTCLSSDAMGYDAACSSGPVISPAADRSHQSECTQFVGILHAVDTGLLAGDVNLADSPTTLSYADTQSSVASCDLPHACTTDSQRLSGSVSSAAETYPRDEDVLDDQCRQVHFSVGESTVAGNTLRRCSLDLAGRGVTLSRIAEESAAGLAAGDAEHSTESLQHDAEQQVASVREPRRRSSQRSLKDQNVPNDAVFERASDKISELPSSPGGDVRWVLGSASFARSSSFPEPRLTDLERTKNQRNSGNTVARLQLKSSAAGDQCRLGAAEPVATRPAGSADIKTTEKKECLRYDREFLLRLRSSVESQRKPIGLPQMPEIIIDMQSLEASRRPCFLPNFPVNMLPIYVPPPPIIAGPAFTRSAVSASAVLSRRHHSGGRADHTPTRKVITVSLQQAVQLHTADNAWRSATLKASPADATDPERLATQEVYRKLRSILNKLTLEKMQKLMQQVNELNIDTDERLKGCIDVIFEKAISEPGYSAAYAQMAKCLVNLKVPKTGDAQEAMSFRKLLLNRCQHEFETDQKEEGDFARMQVAIDNATSDEQRRQLTEEKNLAELKARQRSLGNIRFIGELFKLKMLTEGIMHDCIRRLLRSRDEESLECLCRLLTTIGCDLDKDRSRPLIVQYMTKIRNIMSQQKVSTRIKFMLQDVIELRDNCWISRHEAVGRPKTEAPAAAAMAATANDDRPPASMMHRIASSPAMTDHHGRHQSRASPAFVTTDELWKPGGRGAQHGRLIKPPADENILLGPPSRTMWQGGSAAGRRTPSVESNKQTRMQGSTGSRENGRNVVGHIGAREMALHSSEKDRSAAIAAVRSLASGPGSTSNVRPTLSRGGSDVTSDLISQSTPQLDSTVKQGLSDAELDQKTLSILEEYLHICDIREAVSCFQELGAERLDGCVSVIVNHVVEKCRESRQLAGTLLLELITEDLLTVDQFVNGMKEVFASAEDTEIDVPKIWQYLAEVIGPMIRVDGALPLNFFYRTTESVRLSRKVSLLIADVLNYAASQLGESTVAEMWRNSGLEWSSFVPSAQVQAFLVDTKLDWIENVNCSSEASVVPNVSVSEAVDSLLSRLLQLIADKDFDSDVVRAFITDNEVLMDQSRRRQLIRSMTTAVCEMAISENDEDGTFSVTNSDISRRADVLMKYINRDHDLELQALYAVQELVHRLHHPRGVLRSLFDVFYDEEIISEETFRRWQGSSDPAEQAGKGVAVKSVQQFFTWLDGTSAS